MKSLNSNGVSIGVLSEEVRDVKPLIERRGAGDGDPVRNEAFMPCFEIFMNKGHDNTVGLDWACTGTDSNECR